MEDGSHAVFPTMSDSSSVVSKILDSMAMRYRNMGGLVFDAGPNNSPSVTSWVHCGAPMKQDAKYIRQLLMDESTPPLNPTRLDEGGGVHR